MMKTFPQAALRSACALTLVAIVVAPVQAAVVYVAPTGNDAHAGTTTTAPVATVNKGIQLAAAAGGGSVKVMAGSYDGLVTLLPGVTVEGGYDAGFKAPSLLTDAELKSEERNAERYPAHTRLSHRAGDRVVVANGLKTEAALSNVIVLGPDQSERPGRSSYAVVVQGSGTLHLKSVKLIAGFGGPGLAGETPQAATEWCTAGGTPGTAREFDPPIKVPADGRPVKNPNELCTDYEDPMATGCRPVAVRSCESTAGNPGESVLDIAGKVLVPGGEGGPAGKSACLSADWFSAENGQLGGRGGDGMAGGAGHPNPERAAVFVLKDGVIQWSGSPGGTGGRGQAGGGGGGGGTGGSYAIGPLWCAGVSLGGLGGTGGRGGCGGAGGSGGQPGSGSFAVVVQDTTITTERIGILLGHGGPGGRGADGGRGMSGTDGATGQASQKYKVCAGAADGNRGGHGGAGGQGGGGAGGNGGPSVALALIGKASAHRSHLFHVASAATSHGGEGGRVGAQPHGDPGLSGLSASEAQGHHFVLAQAARDALFVEQTVPGTMAAGQAYEVAVQMRNTGTQTWTAADGYRLGSRKPDDNVLWGSSRVDVPSMVSPGQSVTFKFKIRAPGKAGTYDFQWRVVQENVAWFGATTENVSVVVK